MLLTFAATASAQMTKLKLSSVIPGTEHVQLVYNGDFQFTGAPAGDGFPFPDGWSRQADIFAGAGTNMVPGDEQVVVYAFVSNAAPVCKYQRSVTLLPNTDYVLSAYLWNFGDTANHVVANVDLNDVPQDPQLSLAYSDSKATDGYFVYRSFNTANSGTNVTLRVFYDGLTGTGASSGFYPLAAQWDNIAITKASDFAAPQPAGSGANIRPTVRIVRPADGMFQVLEGAPAALTLAADSADRDGTVASVAFFADTTEVVRADASPFSAFWTNPPAGSYCLTAMATDNQGDSTVSAPVSISVWTAPPPAALGITALGANVVLTWPDTATAPILQSASNLDTTTAWMSLTNAPVLVSTQNNLTVPRTADRQFFRLGPEVDASTLTGKLLMGYQGWFACSNDTSSFNRWVHWFRNNNPVASNLTVDFWPDISELDPDELFATGMTLTNGSPAKVYSAFNRKTVVRHFKWMKDHHLDGVFLQRFTSSLSDPANFSFRNQVTTNVRIGADTYGRVFAIMYDISGQNPATLVSTVTNDWAFLVNTLQVTSSPQYLRHRGKPVVAVWGFGFLDRPGTPEDAQAVIAFFKSAGCTVVGGVPSRWRTLTNDSQTNAAWAAVYRSFDVISPWLVGRFSDTNAVDQFKTNQIMPDLAECATDGIDYLPVLFPGFSWHNLKGEPSPLNQIPRLGGAFYWRQAYDLVDAGCTMLYGAMFDEMDEGTAMFKLAPTQNELPVEATLVPLNADGQTLPSDWYLRLADQAGKMLRHEIPLQPEIPITP